MSGSSPRVMALTERDALLDAWDEMFNASQRVETALPQQMSNAIVLLEVARNNMRIAMRDWATVSRTTAAEAQIARLREALEAAEETLRLAEHPAFPDPIYHDEVKRLGQRIGFGALMSTASAAWREELVASGYPVGGEFVSGPCHSSIIRALSMARAALHLEGPK